MADDENICSEDNDSDIDSQNSCGKGNFNNYCSLHDLQPLDYFCQTCDMAVCADCLKPPPQQDCDSSEEYLSTDMSNSHHSSSPSGGVLVGSGQHHFSRHEGHCYVAIDGVVRSEKLKIERLNQSLQMRIGEAEDAEEHLKIIEESLKGRLVQVFLLCFSLDLA